MSADAQEGERLGVGGLPIHGGLTPVPRNVFARALLSKDEVDDLLVGNFYRLAVTSHHTARFRRCTG
jgi:hypothetical protein